MTEQLSPTTRLVELFEQQVRESQLRMRAVRTVKKDTRTARSTSLNAALRNIVEKTPL